MDLYNSLKEGALEDALLAEFQRQLDEAKERLNKESQEEAELAKYRQDLATAIFKYVQALSKEEFTPAEQGETLVDICNALVNFEKNFDSLKNLQLTFDFFFDDDEKEKEEDASGRNEDQEQLSTDEKEEGGEQLSLFEFFNSPTHENVDKIFDRWLKML